ncbi:unnamed protein product, partial [Allacma fusca]
ELNNGQMDLQTRNRSCEKDDVNKQAIPPDTSARSSSPNSNDDQEFLITMPVLRLTPFDLIRKSYWKRPQGSSRNSSCKWLLKRLVHRKIYRPPFNTYLKTPTFTDSNFNEFVLNIPIISLSLDLNLMDADGLCLNQRLLWEVLAPNNSNITNLEIRAKINSNFVLEKNTPMDKMMLTSLKRLKFHDWCNSCTHTEFMQNILNRCEPESLDLYIFDKDSVAPLLAQDKVANLKTLKLSIRKVSKNVWSHLGYLRF